MDLPDRESVKDWMLRYQRGRRNLTKDQLLALAVANGQEPPPGHTPTDLEHVRTAIREGKIDRLISGRDTLQLYRMRAARARKALEPKAPSKAPEARSTAQIVDDRRAEQEAKRAKLEADRVTRRLVELEDALSFMHAAPAHPPVIHTPSTRPKSGKRIATPVFVISDTHFGERVTLQESLGTNEYDLKVAAARMAKCWDNMLWLRDDMARTQSCDDTLICLNGDIVSGDIHAELSETNDGGMREQCDAAFSALYPGLKAMAEATPGVLHIVCIGGNHGRVTHKQQIKNGTEHSAEHLGVYDPLRRVLGDMGGKVAWHIPAGERHIIEVHGRRVSQQHGTMIRSQGGIGGTLVPMTRWVTRTNDADLYIFGHFHEADAYGKVIKNGALIGESGYTKWLGVESRPPEQVAFVLDADAGVRRFERVSVRAGAVGREA
jgi:predicted phosphodiesterase